MITGSEKFLSTWTPEGREAFARILRPIVERARAAKLLADIEFYEMQKPWSPAQKADERKVAS